MVGAGFRQHPGVVVPVKHHRKGQVAAGGQHGLRGAEGPVAGQRNHRNVAPPGGQVEGLAEEIPAAVPGVKQRVGVPGLAVEGQGGKDPFAQRGQRFVGRDAAHRNGVDFLLAGKFFQKPPRRHMEGTVNLIHGLSLVLALLPLGRSVKIICRGGGFLLGAQKEAKNSFVKVVAYFFTVCHRGPYFFRHRKK